MAEQEPKTEVESDSNNSEETEAPKPSRKIPIGAGHWQRFKTWYGSHKKHSIPLSILTVLLLLAVIPWTRYQIVGLVYKKDFNIKVLDSKTNTAVSGALVSVGSANALTNGNGQAKLHISVGPHTFLVAKKYYKTASASETVPILSQKSVPTVSLTATGRQVKIKLTNSVNHKVLADAEIKVAGTTAKTGTDGIAIVVLPVGTATQAATISLNGYNDAKATIKVSDSTIEENNLTLTPAGSIYFLSKLSGKIDVVKTNLDGTDRQTVFAGTGKEEDNGTVLLASRDWKYLALLARHDTDLPQLYLIETSTDKVTTMDEGNATFNLIGWDNDSFIYQVTRNSYADWQAKKFALKSFDANSKQLIVLDQTDATGDASSYGQEQLGDAYNLGDTILYYKIWYKFPYYTDPSILNGKQDGIYTIRPDGSGKTTVKSLDATTTTYISPQPGKPGEVYLTYDQNSSPVYSKYSNGSMQTLTAAQYPNNSEYNTYLLSPSGNQTFWSEQRDGKNTLMIGDENADNGKTIASLSDFQTYGWYSDNYLLVSKNSSELYIMPVGGLQSGEQPIKISDYHKPAQNFYGYGGGYGGI